MIFEDCIMECAKNKELIVEFDRLNKSNLSMRGAPIELMVDEATGRLDKDLRDFCMFVFYCVWLPLATPAAKETT